ncbi:DUF3152 domain-containing protein [Streptomyces sp. NPDC017890]|uniref:DUF3152 domain-containing protein n=1 Tax=Streptomyces sp. NPDC017890 TaxID=3365015 RepID=UPI00378DDB4C
MGRHSRRGPAPKADAADTAAAREPRPGLLGRRRAPGPPAGEQASPVNGTPGAAPHRATNEAPGGAYGTQDGVRGGPQGYAGPPSPGPRFPDGTPTHGFVTVPGGTPVRGFPTVSEGTPAQGFPRTGDGTPPRGAQGFPDGTPAHGVPRTRGGHPEQREPGGGWGELSGRTGPGQGAPAGPSAGAPSQPGHPAHPSHPAHPGPPGRSVRSGPSFPRQRQAAAGEPRQEYLDAFGEDGDVFAARPPRRNPVSPQSAGPYASVTDWSAADGGGGITGGGITGSGVGGGVAASGADSDAPPTGEPAPVKGGKGRTFTGIAAAAVTTVLAVVVAGQVADGSDGEDLRAQSATDQARGVDDSASRADGRPTPSAPETAAPLTYEQKMEKRYPLSATLEGSGKFDAVPGIAKGPGTGRKYTYRVDVEQGLGLDGQFFAEAVQKTLNDDRSWAHNGARTFERVHSGQPDFVITLASPGTTADWCAKSGLDTTVDNVSCDSAATERVMINAYRWAQGAEPYGDDLHGYRQMLINHEIGHRIGFNHVTCDKDGELAPVMQQQTKFIDHDGIDCRPNPWAYPNS